MVLGCWALPVVRSLSTMLGNLDIEQDLDTSNEVKSTMYERAASVLLE